MSTKTTKHEASGGQTFKDSGVRLGILTFDRIAEQTIEVYIKVRGEG